MVYLAIICNELDMSRGQSYNSPRALLSHKFPRARLCAAANNTSLINPPRARVSKPDGVPTKILFQRKLSSPQRNLQGTKWEMVWEALRSERALESSISWNGALCGHWLAHHLTLVTSMIRHFSVPPLIIDPLYTSDDPGVGVTS